MYGWGSGHLVFVWGEWTLDKALSKVRTSDPTRAQKGAKLSTEILHVFFVPNRKAQGNRRVKG